jgi:hypothetical protein
MIGEPGDHRDAWPVHVIGELVELKTFDAGIDQDQPIIRALSIASHAPTPIAGDR